MTKLQGLSLLCASLALSSLSLVLTARAQDTRLGPPPPLPKPAPSPRDEDYEVVRVSSNLVVVPVSVTDSNGHIVTGLTVTDFRLQEEGRIQKIAQIADAEEVPLELALLLDVSGSVYSRMDFIKEAAAQFLKQVLKPADKATVYLITFTPELEFARVSADEAARRLKTIQPTKGPTAFYDAVIEAARFLSASTPAQHRRVIVCISDGEDNFSEKVRATIGETSEAQRSASHKILLEINEKMRAEVQREVQRSEASFYSINPSGQSISLNVISARAQQGMKSIADATGGASYVPDRVEELDKIFRQITADLRSQYLLQYYSSDAWPSGKFLRLNVSVPARPDVRLRARQGFYVKGKHGG